MLANPADGHRAFQASCPGLSRTLEAWRSVWNWSPLCQNRVVLPDGISQLGPATETADQSGVLSGLITVAVINPDNHRVGGLDRGKRLSKRLFHVGAPPGGKDLECQAGPLALTDRFEHPGRVALEIHFTNRQRNVSE